MTLIRGYLRREHEAELEKRLRKVTKEEIEDELKCCDLLQQAYELLVYKDSWFKFLKSSFDLITPERKEKARRSWLKISQRQRAQVATVFISIIFNEDYNPDVIMFPVLVILAEAEDQLVWRYSEIEIYVKHIQTLNRRLQGNIDWIAKMGNRLITRLTEYEQDSEVDELLDKCLIAFNSRFRGTARSVRGKIVHLDKLLFKRQERVLDFLNEHLPELTEQVTQALEARPSYREMPCSEVVALLREMYARDQAFHPQTPKEAAAFDHMYRLGLGVEIGYCSNELCWEFNKAFWEEDKEEKKRLFANLSLLVTV